jgi:hypothetical protein
MVDVTPITDMWIETMKPYTNGNYFNDVELLTPAPVFHVALRILCQLVYRKRQRTYFHPPGLSYIALSMLKRRCRRIVAHILTADKPEDGASAMVLLDFLKII